MTKLPKCCPICASPFMSWVKTLPKKIGGTVELFYCMECESFSSPFSVPANNPPSDVEWHKSVLKRNLKWSHNLLQQLIEKGMEGPIVDIGCGIGSLLLAADKAGISGVGFDLDTVACEYGRNEFGLNLRGELWHEEDSPDFGLITIISVLEHIHQPRELIRDMIYAARARNAKIFISVPFFNRDWWKLLHTDNFTPGHPFEVPHAHVTHFSHRGLDTVCRQFGAKDLQLIQVKGGWLGFLVTP